jgi:Fic-DOC domain mobile mystery protein B
VDVESKNSIFYTPKGATPIEPDDLQFLIPRLRTRAQLNDFEERNIFDAKERAHISRDMRRNLISIDGLTKLHFWMFNEVWTWAGQLRTRTTNIGIEVHQIRPQLAALIGNAQHWIENNTYPSEECAVRFHHELVKIHLFPNGNGRHSRLVADLMMFYSGQPEFTWGSKSIDVEGKIRNRYLAALEKADRKNYDDLMEFATTV